MTVLRPAPDGYPIKLVRDQTEVIVNPSGVPGELWYGDAPPDADVARLLRLKLAEEVGEYLVDANLKELLDVLAVVEALCITHDAALEGAIALMRGDPRGGFLSGRVMYGRHAEYDR